MKGTVITIASIIRKVLTPSIEVYLPTMKLGTDAPIVLDIIPAKTPVKVTIPILYFENQFKATLLGVFSTKMFPIAANRDPNRQNTDCSSFNNSLSQTPPDTKMAAATKQGLIPYLLMRKLKGKARRGCIIVKRSPLRVT